MHLHNSVLTEQRVPEFIPRLLSQPFRTRMSSSLICLIELAFIIFPYLLKEKKHQIIGSYDTAS